MWNGMLRDGYYVDHVWKERLGPELRRVYASGLISGNVDGNLPILL